ncbi:unnamed protein product [Arctia plantaginis]|uniref:Uncharacterized protein n=1 Tax=Arctia plantaginis TaxID=874455 RepID=A0A8S0ZRP1_ARCPL|nr:unnamed protein product [Arctia plantaginis]
MDEQSLVQICESAFSTVDIKVAKSLLFESLSKRPTTRKREGRTLRDLEDIISLFKETDPEKIPIFVARKLEKLPPVSFDHIDVTVLLKKIVYLKKCTRISISLCDQRHIGGRLETLNSGPMTHPTLRSDESLAEHNAPADNLSLSSPAVAYYYVAGHCRCGELSASDSCE